MDGKKPVSGNLEWQQWLATRPPAVRELAKEFPVQTEIIDSVGEKWYVVGYAEYKNEVLLYISETSPNVDYVKAIATREIICPSCLRENTVGRSLHLSKVH